MKGNIFFTIAIVAAFLASCTNAHEPETHNPVVTLTAPVNGNMYHNSDTVHMSIHMSDQDELHEGFLYIRSAVDTFFSYQPYVHELPTYQLDTFWVVNSIATNTNVLVTGIALNHVNGSDTVQVAITCMP